MKKAVFIIPLLLIIILAACTKQTLNYYSTPVPAYTISGLHDMSISAGSESVLNLTFQYEDSTQGTVTVENVSGMPSQVFIDSSYSGTVFTGVPTFTTNLAFKDVIDSVGGATAGIYPITLTTESATGIKTFTFNLTVE